VARISNYYRRKNILNTVLFIDAWAITIEGKKISIAKQGNTKKLTNLNPKPSV